MKDRNSENGIVTCQEGLQVNHYCVEDHTHFRKDLEIVGHLMVVVKEMPIRLALSKYCP
jgi:hypothetical protein